VHERPTTHPDPIETTAVFVPHIGWLEMPLGDDVARYLREGWFEHEEQALWWLALREGDAVIDGGAHAGLYTRLAALAGASVIAAEPMPATAALLEHNTKELVGVTIERCALWSRTGTALLGEVPPERSAYAAVQEGGEGIEVGADTIDTLIDRADIADVTVLKLDLEGAEREALLGAKDLLARRGAMVVMVELTPRILRERGIEAREAMAPLTEQGYAPMRLDPKTLALAELDLSSISEHTNAFFVADRERLASRLSDAPEQRRRIARELIERGALTRSIKDGCVERDHALGLVDELKADLQAAHERLAAAQARSDSELRTAHREYDRALGDLRDALAEAHRLWSESRAVYEDTIGALRDQVRRVGEASDGAIQTLRTDLDHALKQWSAAEAAHEKTASALRGELAASRDGWESARDGYERTIASLREDLEAAHREWARTREAYERARHSGEETGGEQHGGAGGEGTHNVPGP